MAKKSQAEKFGVSAELLARWKAKPFFLPGEGRRKKTLIILVHGWSISTKQVRFLAEKLQEYGFSASAPRLRGHGTRPEDLEGVTWKDWLADVVKEIRRRKRSGEFERIVVGGVSMGGNLSLLASLEEEVDGLFLIGAPVYLKNHLFIKTVSIIAPWFVDYIKKRRPKKISYEEDSSYQYFPVINMREILQTIKESVRSLKKIKTPLLILQTKNDFFVTKQSPWIIYKNVPARTKRIQWIETDTENHVPQGEEVDKVAEAVRDFVDKI